MQAESEISEEKAQLKTIPVQIFMRSVLNHRSSCRIPGSLGHSPLLPSLPKARPQSQLSFLASTPRFLHPISAAMSTTTSTDLSTEVESLRKQLASLQVLQLMEAHRLQHSLQAHPLTHSLPPHFHACCMQSTLQEKEAQQQQSSTVWPYSKSYGRTSINTIIGSSDSGKGLVRVRACHLQLLVFKGKEYGQMVGLRWHCQEQVLLRLQTLCAS